MNRSFGLTTLRDRHARVQGTSIRFRFRGKSGQQHEVGLRDRRLAAVVRRCQDLPGQELFQYLDPDGTVRDVASDDVNDYLRDISGGDFTAKDFRTWAGTVLAYRALRALQPDDDSQASKRVVVEAIKETAGRLGNTPAVARRSYVHPAIFEAYFDGSIGPALVEVAEEQVVPPGGASPAEEAAVVRLLRQRQRHQHARRERSRRSPEKSPDRAARLTRPDARRVLPAHSQAGSYLGSVNPSSTAPSSPRLAQASPSIARTSAPAT